MSKREEYEVLTAICFFSDACEHTGDDVFSLIAEKAAEKFLESVKAYPEDHGIIQSACYGLGAIAKRSPMGTFGML